MPPDLLSLLPVTVNFWVTQRNQPRVGQRVDFELCDADGVVFAQEVVDLFGDIRVAGDRHGKREARFSR